MRASTSGSVSGSTPWPRLNTCPVPPPRSSTSRVCASTTSHGARTDGGVEISLQRVARADTSSGLVERHPPVHADDLDARAGHQREQLSGADTEVDARHAEIGQALEHLARGGQHVALVVGGGERPHPAVEELDGGCPRRTWRAQRRQCHVGQDVEQSGEQGRVAPHQGLGAGVDARRPPFDQVAGHGERSAGEADERDPEWVELRRDETDRVEDVAGVGLGLEGPEPRQVVGVAEGSADHGAPALLDLHAEPNGRSRHDDVGEEDGGVDAVAAHRLQGQLGRELGPSDGVEHASVTARRSVLGQ